MHGVSGRSAAQARAQFVPGVKRHELSPALVEPPLVDLAEREPTPPWKFLHALLVTQAHLVVEVVLAANVPAVRGATLIPVFAVVLLEHAGYIEVVLRVAQNGALHLRRCVLLHHYPGPYFHLLWPLGMPHPHRTITEEGEIRKDRTVYGCHAVGLIIAQVLRYLGPSRPHVVLDDGGQRPGLVEIGAVHAHAMPTSRAHLHRCRPAPVGGLCTPLDLDGRAVAIGGVIEVTDEVVSGKLPVAGICHLCVPGMTSVPPNRRPNCRSI